MSILDKDIEFIRLFEKHDWLLDEYHYWLGSTNLEFLATRIETKGQHLAAAFKLVRISKRKATDLRLIQKQNGIFRFHLTLK